MFHYSQYWGTWSRILLHPGDMVGDRIFGSYLEVNLTPINGRYDNSTQKLWNEEVKPIVLRTHSTVPQPGEMRSLLTPMVVTAMIMNVGDDLTRRLIADDLLSRIDLPTLLDRMRGGGIPLWECRKSLLTHGLIPKGQPCPFLDQCGLRVARCPTSEQSKAVDYSCAAARAHDM